MLGTGYPTTTLPIWAAQKRRKTSAGTQNLRHHDKFGGAGVAQACASRRRGGARPARGWREPIFYLNFGWLAFKKYLCEVIVAIYLVNETHLKIEFEFDFFNIFFAKAQYLCNIVNEKLRVTVHFA